MATSPADAMVPAGLRSFCEKHGIKASTGKNRTSRFSSLIVDWDGDRLLPNFPAEMLDKYEKLRVGDFNVAYSEGLSLPDSYSESNDATIFSQQQGSDKPFCCEEIVPFKPRHLDTEALFSDFLRGTGNHPNVVYEVKEQVDNGPLLSTKYYKLCNDNIGEIEGSNFKQKMHAFKNFKCAQHNRFYGVDLYREGNDAGSNFHHMRVNPFTKCDGELLDEFFSTN
ncbi:hypothetical protein T492DRAFT_889546 [Pavlovales sp. CCMP2436]|nr:hypothetical protein T492DRAFT_889546 [Pavlovales sp. CCMP2436]